MASSSKPPSSAVEGNGSSSISVIHPDIIRTHILPRLDGPTLASAASTSTHLNLLASQDELWTGICNSTWPSTVEPRVRQVISNFRDGYRSFFADCFPLLSNVTPSNTPGTDLPTELISAVDFYYRGEVIFSKVVETETVSGYFRCSPFRIDMLDPKDTCPTELPHADTEEACRELASEFSLSWILIDPAGRRAMNLSSQRPVAVHRHWLNGDVHARFAVVMAGERGSPSEYVQSEILVTCGGGGMQVREVSLQLEDMDGMILNGKGSLGILHRAFGGKKVIRRRMEGEGKRKYEEFLEMKRERQERKLRTEGTSDILCVASGVLICASLGLFLWI